MEVKYSDLPYGAARIKEQQLIVEYKTLNRGNYRNNQINGLSRGKSNLSIYIQVYNDYFGEEVYVGGIKW